MFNDLSYASLETILKFFGRVGFSLVLLAVYKFYNVFASPLVKAKHRHFVTLFTISVIISFLLLILSYIIPLESLSTVSLLFNVSTTFILAFYLYRQSTILEAYRGSEEFQTLARSMDSFIAVLKHR